MQKGLMFEKLFIFEMANNHGGDVAHGVRIIRELKEVCAGHDLRFAIKLQYRDLDTFIHPAYQQRQDLKYIKRFTGTRLGRSELKVLRDEIKACGFMAICTPFDEPSVDLVEAHGFDMIKIASCSLTDWPLLERVAKTTHPLIISTAGACLEDLDKVVFFMENRKKDFAIMHCVGEYPTPDNNLRMDRINLLQERYPGVPVGFSTHEAPDNLAAVQIGVAKGAFLFEKHVGVRDAAHEINAYSATPAQIAGWLLAARAALAMCSLAGSGPSDKEKADLKGLQRGVFARTAVLQGEKLTFEKLFFAIPNIPGQVLANDVSKYTDFVAKKDIAAGEPVLFSDVAVRNVRERVLEIMKKVRAILLASNVALPPRLNFELSHHYGIDRFEECGAAIINYINREYCKKLIIMLPGQRHPVHHHVKKEETFNVLYGHMVIEVDGVAQEYAAGDMIVIERGQKHSFSSSAGAVFEEISTTHVAEDSFYDDAALGKDVERKTYMTLWQDWFKRSA